MTPLDVSRFDPVIVTFGKDRYAACGLGYSTLPSTDVETARVLWKLGILIRTYASYPEEARRSLTRTIWKEADPPWTW